MFLTRKKILLPKIVSLILIVFTFFQCSPQPKPVPDSTLTQSTGFALLELFTSQGCSSCPPADNLLGEYSKKDDDHIMTLAFHVDYWNRLGWIDSFSSSTYSDRQRYYAAMMNNESVYTPQLIINGSKDIVGSDRQGIERAVKNVLNERSEISITIGKIEINMEKLIINYSIDSIIQGTTLQVALVQKQVATNILKGENRGLKLTNYNVVRNFMSISSYPKRTFSKMKLPQGFNENEFSVVLYIQDNATGKILSAAKKEL